MMNTVHYGRGLPLLTVSLRRRREYIDCAGVVAALWNSNCNIKVRTCTTGSTVRTTPVLSQRSGHPLHLLKKQLHSTRPQFGRRFRDQIKTKLKPGQDNQQQTHAQALGTLGTAESDTKHEIIEEYEEYFESEEELEGFMDSDEYERLFGRDAVVDSISCWACGKSGHLASNCTEVVTESFDIDGASSRLRHRPVLIKEALNALAIHENDGERIYLDATFGAGGHTRDILQRNRLANVIAMDRDPSAIKIAQQFRESSHGRVVPIHGKFSEIAERLTAASIEEASLDGVLMDVGVSSMQLDDVERGFSFRASATLDMRMDANPNSVSAFDVVNTANEQQLANIIKRFSGGSEKYYKRIAAAIVAARKRYGKISSTKQLSVLIEAALGKPNKNIHPATLTFQALRIFVNDEYDELVAGLEQSSRFVKVGGTLVVIVFHSGEEHLLRRFARQRNAEKKTNTDLPMFEWSLAATPRSKETKSNPRSRSAKMIYGVRVS
eukprot:m.247628 g.247628  ORF g.247628 m.247628 type:complete len:495 (-) comp33857_c6_seq7:108-1592(-)